MSETVNKIVSKIARATGYSGGRSSNWSKDFEDCIHIIGLQKSRWGRQNYLETGIWLKFFGPDECPPYYECHVRLRLSSNSGLVLDDIEAALDEEDYWKMDIVERSRLIGEALSQAEASFFGKAKTVLALREFLQSKHGLNLAVDKVVWDFIRNGNR